MHSTYSTVENCWTCRRRLTTRLSTCIMTDRFTEIWLNLPSSTTKPVLTRVHLMRSLWVSAKAFTTTSTELGYHWAKTVAVRLRLATICDGVRPFRSSQTAKTHINSNTGHLLSCTPVFLTTVWMSSSASGSWAAVFYYHHIFRNGCHCLSTLWP